MISTGMYTNGGNRRAFVADQHKATAAVRVRLLPQDAPGIGAVEVFGVVDATLGRSGGSLV